MKLTKILILIITLAIANISAMEVNNNYSLKDLQNKIRSLQQFLIKSNFDNDNDQSKKQDALAKIRNLPVSINGKKSLDVSDEKISKELVHDIRILVNLIYSKLYTDENDLSVKKGIVDCSSDLAKMQNDLVLYNTKISKKQQDDDLLSDLSKLHQTFNKNLAIENTRKPSFLERFFVYDPKMIALRKTLSELNSDKKFTQKRLASIFGVSQSTVSEFLHGFNSKKLLKNFYELTMKEKDCIKNELDTTSNSFTVTESESDFLLRKNK